MLARRHFLAAATAALSKPPVTPWGDSERLGRPYAKDPSVIRFRGRYLMYFSVPSYGDGRPGDGWAVGIAESRDLLSWKKIAEIPPAAPYESKGLAAPFAKVIGDTVHLFYQTYGNGAKDAICHATSSDGLRFERDPSNPVFHPTGAWNAGRAIDGEVVEFNGRWLLYAATRDPQMKIQMVVGAESSGGFARDAWRMLGSGPILKPELDWEQDCIEAPALLVREGWLYMFYAGAYNNAPQQIGVARSRDGHAFQRMGTKPLFRNGAPGSWNSSESGHPGVFQEGNLTRLFFQGNPDNGRTWLLSHVTLGWRDGWPYVRE